MAHSDSQIITDTTSTLPPNEAYLDASIKRQIERLSAEIKRLQAENGDHMRRRAEYKKAYLEHRSNVERLNNRVSELQTQLASVTSDRDNFQEQLTSVTEECEKLLLDSKDHQHMQRKFEELQRRFVSVERDRNALRRIVRVAPPSSTLRDITILGLILAVLYCVWAWMDGHALAPLSGMFLKNLTNVL